MRWGLPLLVTVLYEYVSLLTLVKRGHVWSWGKVSFMSLPGKVRAGMGPTRPTSIDRGVGEQSEIVRLNETKCSFRSQ